jgi:hypothetical protein
MDRRVKEGILETFERAWLALEERERRELLRDVISAWEEL